MEPTQPRALWMTAPSGRQQSTQLDEGEDDFCILAPLMDLQRNNSRKKSQGSTVLRAAAAAAAAAAASAASTDASFEHLSDRLSIVNTNSLARGADAVVKNSFSRSTVIIDISKLLEEGKVETEYYEEPPEVVEEQDHAMVDDYEKLFAHARRMKALINMEFKDAPRRTIDTNFLKVKAHDHPTQLWIDRWRNVDCGIGYNDQVKLQKQIQDYKADALSRIEKGKTADDKGDKGDKGDKAVQPVYPEMLRFTVRFRKDNSEKRWLEHITNRQKEKKHLGNAFRGLLPKPQDKYLPAFMDVWSEYVVVFVKPTATVREIIEPVFTRLGLVNRADFDFTVGCFTGDVRTGGGGVKIVGMPKTPLPVQWHSLVSELYKMNCTEIYVNDIRFKMFKKYPAFFEPQKRPGKAGELPDPEPAKANSEQKDKKKEPAPESRSGKQGQANKSNAPVVSAVDQTDSCCTKSSESGGFAC